MHKRCAEALTERKANPARVAKHWLATSDGLKAIPALLEAAHATQQALRVNEVVHFLEVVSLRQERLGDEAGLFNSMMEKLQYAVDLGHEETCHDLLTKLKQLAKTDEADENSWPVVGMYYSFQTAWSKKLILRLQWI